MTTPGSRNSNALKAKDFAECPVWEFLSELACDETEEFVAPLHGVRELTPAILRERFILLVAAKFALADGTILQGCMSPCLEPDSQSMTTEPQGVLGDSAPVLFTRGARVGFECGMFRPSDEELQRSYRKIGRDPEAIFPIRVSSQVPCSAGVRGQLVIPGFVYSRRVVLFST